MVEIRGKRLSNIAGTDPVYYLHRSLGLLQASDNEQASIEETIALIKWKILEWSVSSAWLLEVYHRRTADNRKRHSGREKSMLSVHSALPINSVGEAGLL